MKPLRHTSTTQFEVLAARVGVIGDVHAEDALLRNALDHFSTSSIESILCTGDVVDGLGSAQKCCDLLQEYGVLAVRGNHDRWFAEGTFRDLADATPDAVDVSDAALARRIVEEEQQRLATRTG